MWFDRGFSHHLIIDSSGCWVNLCFNSLPNKLQCDCLISNSSKKMYDFFSLNFLISCIEQVFHEESRLFSTFSEWNNVKMHFHLLIINWVANWNKYRVHATLRRHFMSMQNDWHLWSFYNVHWPFWHLNRLHFQVNATLHFNAFSNINVHTSNINNKMLL